MFNLQKLRTIKLVGGAENLSSIYFEHLPTILRSLQRLHINIYCELVAGKLLYDFICCWWSILEKLEHIYIRIEGYFRVDFPRQMDNYRKILFAKNNKSNNCFKIKWVPECFISTSCVMLIIEISKTKIGINE